PLVRWRYRNSAVANRHALHSDYYSTTKKAASLLNERWTTSAPVRRLRTPRIDRRRKLPRDRARTSVRMHLFEPRKENRIARGFSQFLDLCILSLDARRRRPLGWHPTAPRAARSPRRAHEQKFWKSSHDRRSTSDSSASDASRWHCFA